MSDRLQSPDGISIVMIRPHLEHLPEHPLPSGFSMKAMESDDIPRWYEVQRDAEPFNETSDTLFAEQFGRDLDVIHERCRLLIDAEGQAAGCISAWMDPDFHGADAGRIHWVAIRPAWQGQGLAKPMLAEAMKLLTRWHQRAYLNTQTKRIPAINLYLKFGFEPFINNENDRAAWQEVATALPAVGPFLARSSF